MKNLIIFLLIFTLLSCSFDRHNVVFETQKGKQYHMFDSPVAGRYIVGNHYVIMDDRFSDEWGVSLDYQVKDIPRLQELEWNSDRGGHRFDYYDVIVTQKALSPKH